MVPSSETELKREKEKEVKEVTLNERLIDTHILSFPVSCFNYMMEVKGNHI